jgi:hypothetical protein
MNVYLAARYSRRLELVGYRQDLVRLGHQVTARWLNGNHQLSDTGVPLGDHGQRLVEDSNGEQAVLLRTRFAHEDRDDVLRADLLVAFTEYPRSDKGRGGRHVELGIALGAGKPVVIVGPLEHIFCWLPEVDLYSTWAEFLAALGEASP